MIRPTVMFVASLAVVVLGGACGRTAVTAVPASAAAQGHAPADPAMAYVIDQAAGAVIPIRTATDTVEKAIGVGGSPDEDGGAGL